jgi:hypothetical protein
MSGPRPKIMESIFYVCLSGFFLFRDLRMHSHYWGNRFFLAFWAALLLFSLWSCYANIHRRRQETKVD